MPTRIVKRFLKVGRWANFFIYGIDIMNIDHILYEDKDIIVCYKPAGTATQTSKVGSPDMVSEIKGYLVGKDRAKDINGTNTAGQSAKDLYVGLVHRLDQPVEGILVFAKNKRAAANLSAQVQDLRMEKYYLAVVHLPDLGLSEKENAHNSIRSKDIVYEGTLTDYLYQDKSTNTSYVTDEGKSGAKFARLSYRIIEKQVVKIADTGTQAEESGTSAAIALLRIHLLTGRHHQIRVQLTNAGYSLIGDYKYADEETKALSGLLGQKQVALCAYELTFLHPVSGKQLNFRIQPDGEIFHKFKFIESI